VTATEAAEEVLTHLRGWLAATADPVLAAALLDAGCTLVRHAHVMRRHLAESDADELPDPSWNILAFTASAQPPRPWTEVLPSLLGAYPPSHPDHLPGGESLIDDYLIPYTSGGRLGPLIHQASGLAVAGDEVVGGILVVDRPGEGPWISDIWRSPTPDRPGVGAALLMWSVKHLARSGQQTLGLAVTDSNSRARTVYSRAGFIVETTAWTVSVPTLS
jgi:hypothetical protein